MKTVLFALLFVVSVSASAPEDIAEADNEVSDSSSRLNIEHFHSLKNVSIVENQPDITLTARLFIRNGSLAAPEYYETTVKNLKHVAPKVRTLDLFGGHVFYPEQSTAEAVRTEIETVKTNIHSLLAALRAGNITVTSNVFTILIIVDRKTHEDASEEEYVAKTFGKEAIVDDSSNDGLELLYNDEQTDVHLYILFLHHIDQVTETKLPHGYTSYARAVKLHLESIYKTIEAKTDQQNHEGSTKLFLPGVKRLNRAGDVHLEDFYQEKFNANITDTSPQPALIQLLFSISIPNVTDVTPIEYYTKAVANLKKAAPSLKRVLLDGGYAFNPKKTSPEDIKSEITFFKENLSAAFKALQNAQIEVVSAKLKLFWLTTKDNAGIGGYPSLLKAAFGHTVTDADIENGRIFLSFDLNGVETVVHLHFFDQSPPELPYGRINYYDAAQLHHEQNKNHQ